MHLQSKNNYIVNILSCDFKERISKELQIFPITFLILQNLSDDITIYSYHFFVFLFTG